MNINRFIKEALLEEVVLTPPLNSARVVAASLATASPPLAGADSSCSSKIATSISCKNSSSEKNLPVDKLFKCLTKFL